MILEGERLSPVSSPTEEQVRNVMAGLTRTSSSFAYLTDEKGNYVQIAGSRPWGVVEYRELNPLNHFRAFQATPKPKYNDGVKISTGAGDIVLQHDEWFLLKDAAEIFVAFLHSQDFPPHVQWRSMNEMLGI